MGKVVKAVGKVVSGVFKAVGNFAGMLFGGPKAPKVSANTSTETRLNGSLVPEENKKIIFGETACGTDERFWETYGSNNTQHVKVYAAAGHEVTSFGNLYLDEFPIPFTGNNANSKYAGNLTRRAVLKGVSANGLSLGSGTRWTASAAMTGCAYFVLDWIYDQAKMPNGIPSRITQVVKGAKVYDPRRDTTVGGAGSHRANDPDTWEYNPVDPNGQPIGRNNALQMLTYQLGLKVRHAQTNLWVLVGGKGVDPNDIEFDTFIVAANNCELERWYSDMILSTGDDHSTNEGIIASAAAGELMDVGGRFSYFVATDDTANIAEAFTESDIVGDIDWEPQRGLSEQYNELPGTFTDPAALFQTRPLPLCFDQAYYDADGSKKRGETMKLAAVQDPAQGQKLLRLQLNRSRIQGVFTAPFNLKGLRVRPWSIVTLTFEPFGWVNKLFRVRQQGIATEGGVLLVLEEEAAAVYLPGTVYPLPAPSAGFGGDPNEEIAVGAVTTLASGVVSGATAVDTIQATWALPSQKVKHTEVQYMKTGDTYWTSDAPLRRDQNLTVIQPLMPTTNYTIRVRHISLFNIPGPWETVTRTTNAVTKNSAGAVTYADGTPVENLKPAEAGANVTGTHISSGIVGQGWGATASEIAASNALSPLGSNQVVDSDLVRGVATFRPTNYGFVGGANVPYYSGVASGPINYVYGYLATATTNSGVFDPYLGSPSNSLDNLKQYGMATLPGDRIFGAALACYTAGTYGVEIKVALYDGAGSYITEELLGTGGRAGVYAGGNPNLMDRVSGFFSVPNSGAYLNVRWAVLLVRALKGSGSGDGHVQFAQLQLCKVAFNQTVAPNYQVGPSEKRSDQTFVNVAAAILNQAWAATSGSEANASNAYLQLAGPNLIRFSSFQKGRVGHEGNWPGNNGLATVYMYGLGYEYAGLAITTPSQYAEENFGSIFHGWPGSSWTQAYKVQGGRRYCMSERLAYADGPWKIRPRFRFFDANKVYLGEGTPVVTDIQLFIGDYYHNYTIVDAPAKAVYCWIESYAGSDRAGYTGGQTLIIDQPCLRQIPPTATAFPGYVDGPNSAEGSDPTGLNVAAAIVSQSEFATLNRPASSVSKLKNNGRSTSSYQVSNGVLTGATLYRSPVYILGSADVSGAARITIAASTLRGSGIIVSYSASSIDGCAYSTTYYVWIYDPDVTGGTVTYVATTDPNAYIDNADYLYVGNIRTTAAAGAAPPPYVPPPTPPGYYDCVAVEAWLPTQQQAFEIQPGDRLLMLNEAGSGSEIGECVSNKKALAYCMRFETVSGITLTCSTTTPILYKKEEGYGAKPAWECDGSEVVPVIDAKGFRWEALACQPGHVGQKQVAHISANDGVYAAGDTKYGFMFTHNIRMDEYVKP